MEITGRPQRRTRRRWFQFRLSTLFLATLLIAALLGWQRERISRWVDSFWNVAGDAPDDHPWPPVTIHVTIAEVQLNSAGGLGVESALADSLGESANHEFGGVVLPSDDDQALATIRSLPQCRRLDVLNQSQVTALNNEPADIKLGSVSSHLGLFVRITPRVSQAGGLSLEIDVEKHEINSDSGIPISLLETGVVISAPRINTDTLQTTIRVPSSQTAVLGGFTPKDNKEFVLILTPYVIRNRAEAERVKMVNEQAFRTYVAEREIIAGRADPWAQ